MRKTSSNEKNLSIDVWKDCVFFEFLIFSCIEFIAINNLSRFFIMLFHRVKI